MGFGRGECLLVLGGGDNLRLRHLPRLGFLALFAGFVNTVAVGGRDGARVGIVPTTLPGADGPAAAAEASGGT